jgi:3-methyladenine DNA glycosylase/8-oxoguanine DNA glycosylase
LSAALGAGAARRRAAGDDAADRRAVAGFVLVREVVRPPWPFRLPPASLDGLTRRRGAGLVWLTHVGGDPVVVAVAQPARERVVLAARAASEAAAHAGIARLRHALGVDDDLADFHARFRDDPLIGRAVRARPELRIRRSPEPWEALAWAITEQLIELDRAVRIQRRMIGALGPRFAGLRDVPPAALVAAHAPARLESYGLAAKRAIAMRRAAREVASGRVAFDDPPGGASAAATAALARLRAIPEIGRWTIEMLALHGLGRLDVVPAGDLGYLKLVGRLQTGHPRAVADEADVRELFAAYAPYAGLAGAYLRLSRLPLPPTRRAGTRWSAAAPASVGA